MSALRAGVIGLGVGAQHIAGYQACENCEVTAICDCDPEVLSRIGRQYPDISHYSSADALLDDDRIDIVSIASYDDAHAAQILRAIESSKHVFVEKPLCLLHDDARAIRAALQANPQIKLSSNLILRMSPRFNDLRQRIADGQLGRLYHLEADYLYGRKHKLTDGWRGRVDDYSVILGGAVHMIDLLRWLSGDEIVAVSACGNRIATRDTQFRYDDMAVGLLKFTNGAVGKVSANFACVHPHFHALSIYGDQGTFINGPQDATLIQLSSEGPQTQLLSTDYHTLPKGKLISGFVQAVLDDSEPPVPADDVFRTLSVCFALQEATQSDQWVTVEYL
jgi:predicted dehydrogenase